MRKLNIVMAFIALLVVIGACTQGGVEQAAADINTTDETRATDIGSLQTNSEVEMKMEMRKLWEDHITWTRNYVISSVDDLEDVNFTAERLLKNQEDIGDAIKPYYGNEAGDKLTGLLKEHIMIATEVVKAAKANDEDAVQVAQNKWSDNANEIAKFLAEANPNWLEDDVADMLNKHLELTTREAVARLEKDYEADVEAYDEIHIQILEMADALSEGIVKQFPEKFGK